jgi:hypothetical protein
MINNRRVAAVICLHFGADYLSYAMRSVSDVVDEYYIQYSPTACHGHYSPVPCPETQAQLEAVVREAITEINKPLYWHTGWWHSEGDQFKEAMQRSGADIVVKLDADELWYPGLLQDAIEQGLHNEKYEMRLSLWHYWRSFHKAFTHDPAAPGRIYFRMFPGNAADTYHRPLPNHEFYGRATIHHFGYALPVDLMRYKVQSHGHKNQFRQDCDWINDVYAANRQTDCHPVGSEYWMQTEDVTPPEFLQGHPFAGLEVIP